MDVDLAPAAAPPAARPPLPRRPLSPSVALLAEWCLAGLVLAIAFFRGLERVPLHMDESLWIAHSLYLEAALDDGFVPPDWLREEASRTAPRTPRAPRTVGAAVGRSPPTTPRSTSRCSRAS